MTTNWWREGEKTKMNLISWPHATHLREFFILFFNKNAQVSKEAFNLDYITDVIIVCHSRTLLNILSCRFQ